MATLENISEITRGKLYLVEEVAPLLRVSCRTMRRYCTEGFVRASKLSAKAWRIDGGAILDFVSLGQKREGE
jgi:predicted site-specific integrase-resolvase